MTDTDSNLSVADQSTLVGPTGLTSLAAQAALGGFSLLIVDRAFDRAGIELALS